MFKVSLSGGGMDWEYEPSYFDTEREAGRRLSDWGHVVTKNEEAGDILPDRLVAILENLDSNPPTRAEFSVDNLKDLALIMGYGYKYDPPESAY